MATNMLLSVSLDELGLDFDDDNAERLYDVYPRTEKLECM
jgi:hypothetical protein